MFQTRLSGQTLRAHCGTALLAAALAFCGASSALAQVQWRSGTAPQSGKPKAEVIDLLAGAGTRDAERHLVVQFSATVTDAQRAQLAAAGVELLSYLGDHAYFAAIAPGGADPVALAETPTLIDAQTIQPIWKLHPVLAERQTPDWAVIPAPEEIADPHPDDVWIGAYVLFHDDVPALDAWAAATASGAVVRQQLFTVNGAVIEIPLIAIDALAADDLVKYIEPALPRMSENNSSNRALTQANLAQGAPYNLTGAGVNVMVYDGGYALATHVDFQGRLTVRDSSGLSSHATHVSGTIGGAGVANATHRGMAPAVTIQSYGFQYDGSGTFLYNNPGDLESDYNQAINVHGVEISNNSIGTNVEPNGFACSLQGDYSVTDSVIDAIARGSLGAPFRIIWANGNERGGSRCDVEGFGDYYSIAPPAGAKNHVAIGAVNSNNDTMTSFSSWGPTDDGRMRPDVSAPGCQSNDDNGVTSTTSSSTTAYAVACGTSMAAPTATGCAALLLEDFKAQFPGQPLFRNSTLKCWLAHSAFDLGNVGPDYQFGYGSIRIQAAIDLMRSSAFTENAVSHGQVYSRSVVVAPGDPELKVTLAWDDLPGTPNVNPALVNDLDLRVYGPTGTQFFPWALNPGNPSAAAVQNQANHIDNLEQVRVNNPQAGTWTIEVYGFDVPQGPQVFSLVGDGAQNVGTTITLPNGAPTTVAPGTPVQFNVQIAAIGETVVPGSPTLHYRLSGGAYQTAPLAPLGGNLYQATLPAADCVDSPEFYITAAGTITGAVASPGNAPVGVYAAQVGTFVTIFADDMETNQGWTVGDTGDNATTGIWTRNNPEGTAAQPEDDHTPAPGVNCWVTDYRAGAGLGTWDVDGGKTTVITPTFDLSATPNATISYWRWYSNNAGANPNANVFNIDISNDNGSTWTAVEIIGPAGGQVSGGWFYFEFTASDALTPTAQMRMRFVASDIGSGAVVEAAVDDFLVTDFVCTPTASCSDGILNQGETRIDCGGPCPACSCTSDAACADGQFCNGVETCDAFGECAAGTPVNCNDSVACTSESCDEGLDTCTVVPNDTFCDNGQYCDGVETCNIFAGCQPGTLVVCDDGVDCTTDSCNESTDACESTPDNGFCDNGLFCDGVETCNPVTDCQPGTPVNCDDGVDCTQDSCNEASDTCDHAPDHGSCDNGEFCDGVEACDLLLDCQPGTPVACDDGVDCTQDSCNEASDTCDHAPDDGLCDNGQFCDGTETCDLLLDCQPGTPVACDDGVDCTVDSCNESTDACEHSPDDGFCDNGLFCDGDETCDELLDCVAGTFPCAGAEWCDDNTDACTPHGNGDFNEDGAVDLRDFAYFQGCYGLPAGPACAAGNLTGPDALIDDADLAEFINSVTGP